MGIAYHPPVKGPMLIENDNGTFEGHKRRNPPSSEPGTDIAVPHGTPVYAVHDGYISEVKRTPGGAMGRKIGLNTDMGRGFNYLHLHRVLVSSGQRVKAGQQIGISGASGFGSDWHYGAHLHITVFPDHRRIYQTGYPLSFEKLYMSEPSTGSGGGGSSNTHPLIGVEMEDYVLVAGDGGFKEGTVYYTYPGYIKKFTSVDDYNAWREIRVKQKNSGQTNRMIPPIITKLEKLPDWRAKAIFSANGVKG